MADTIKNTGDSPDQDKYIEELRVQHFMQMKNWEEFQEPKMVYLGLVDKEDYA